MNDFKESLAGQLTLLAAVGAFVCWRLLKDRYPRMTGLLAHLFGWGLFAGAVSTSNSGKGRLDGLVATVYSVPMFLAAIFLIIWGARRFMREPDSDE